VLKPTTDLEGSVAIVVGAGSRSEGIGNGRASAILLARSGAKVACVDINPSAAEQTSKAIQDEGGEAFVVEADASKEDDCRNVVQATVEKWGQLNVLINIVGIDGPEEDAPSLDMNAWEAAMRVNVSSVVNMAKYSIPAMRPSGGAIVNLTSVAGLLAGVSLFYSTSKGALVNLTRSLAVCHGREGVRVNCVAPGLVNTPMVGELTEEAREKRRLAAALDGEGTAWDIGNAVVFLSSENSRWITGTVLVVCVPSGGGSGGRSSATSPGASRS
jgi:NAD(P)-dependent dehydrogenase (short-subunit alcohol dehydrogenase family)